MSYLAESYENYMVPSLFAPWASYLIERANPQPGERVIDIACSTGIVARRVAGPNRTCLQNLRQMIIKPNFLKADHHGKDH